MKREQTGLVMDSNEQGAPVRTTGSALLGGYMLYMPEDGLGLELFVEHGGQLVGQEERANLLRDLLGLDEKIEQLRADFPRLSRQVELLADFVVQASGQRRRRTARNEALFALIYCARECDLIPDSFPDIGYSDDAAVVELVLARNAAVFEAHCRARGLDWSALAHPGATSEARE